MELEVTEIEKPGAWHNFYPNNTFKGLKIVSKEYSLYYSVWCTNETELFDLHVCTQEGSSSINATLTNSEPCGV